MTRKVSNNIILVSDFDHTLYVNESISPKDIQAIRHFQKSNLFIIATGRSKKSLDRDLNIVKPDYIITNHGATIFKGNEIIYNNILPLTVIHQCINVAREYSLNEFFVTNEQAYADDAMTAQNIVAASKLRIYTTSDDIQQRLLCSLRNMLNNRITCYKESSFNRPTVEIVNGTADKSIAINIIAKDKKITHNNIYAVGDAENDLKMIKQFSGKLVQSSSLRNSKIPRTASVADFIHQIRSSTQ